MLVYGLTQGFASDDMACVSKRTMQEKTISAALKDIAFRGCRWL